MSEWTAPIPTAPQPKKKSKAVAVIVSAVVLLFTLGVGVAIGAAGAKTPEAQVKTRTVTKTDTVTKEVAPQACLDALDDAERMIHGPVKTANGYSIQILGQIPKAFKAGLDQSLPEAQAVVDFEKSMTTKYKTLTGEIDSIVGEYNPAASECRAKAN